MRRYVPRFAKRTVVLMVSALVGIALAAVVATAASNQSNDTTETAESGPPTPEAPPQATGVAPALKAQVKLLRGQPSAKRGDVPPGMAQSIEQQGGRVDLARSTAVGGERLAVVPTSDGACITNRALTTCGPTGRVLAGGLTAVLLCGEGLPAGSIRVFGVLPDGVEKVSFQGAEGKATSAGVIDNVYDAAVSGAPTEASWVDEEGKPQTAALPVPPGYENRLQDCAP
jgi:hypothetical protein